MIVIAVLVLTLAGAGAGGAVGALLAQAKPEPAVPVATAAAPGEAAAKTVEPDAIDLVVRPLAPIVTNLAAPAGTWVRLEGSLLMAKETEENADVLAERAAQQIVTFLRTVQLSHIEGASGFLHLREDLNDVVSVLTAGQIREVVIRSMIVE